MQRSCTESGNKAEKRREHRSDAPPFRLYYRFPVQLRCVRVFSWHDRVMGPRAAWTECSAEAPLCRRGMVHITAHLATSLRSSPHAHHHSALFYHISGNTSGAPGSGHPDPPPARLSAMEVLVWQIATVALAPSISRGLGALGDLLGPPTMTQCLPAGSPEYSPSIRRGARAENPQIISWPTLKGWKRVAVLLRPNGLEHTFSSSWAGAAADQDAVYVLPQLTSLPAPAASC